MMPTANLFAEETDITIMDTAENSDNYYEEIKANCEMEAANLLDADIYIKNCIENMKGSFSEIPTD